MKRKNRYAVGENSSKIGNHEQKAKNYSCRMKACRNRFSFLVALCLSIAFAVVLFLAAAVPAYAAGRSYYFPQVLIEADVHPDGSMSVVEERTYDFSGRYTGAWEYIFMKYGATVKDVLVSEQGEPYQQMPPGTQDIPGIFYTEPGPDRSIHIDWSFVAADEQRTFTISYTVENAVLVHEDVAELYYQFIGDEWDERTAYAKVVLTLPAGAAAGELRVWGHGPLQGNVFKEEDNKVVWEVEDLPRRTFLEGRVAFPMQLVPQATAHSGREGLPVILAEEEKWAAEANKNRLLSQIDVWGGIIIVLAALIFYLVLRRRSLRHPQAYQGDYFRELPGDYSPAEAGNFFRLGRTAPEDFTATILDLARRGHLRLEAYQEKKGIIRKRTYTDYRVHPGEGSDQLAAHETKVLKFIFESVAAQPGGSVTFNEIETYPRRQKKSAATFYQNWEQAVEKLVKNRNFYGPAAWAGIIAGLALLLAGTALFFVKHIHILASVSIFTGILLMIFTAKLKNLSPGGADHYAKWKAFRRFLLHFSEMERSTIPALEIWEYYLVYAVALGVGKEVMKQLEMVYPQLQDHTHLAGTAWFYTAMANPARFDHFTTSIKQSFRTATKNTTMPCCVN
jgi:uncharacterized membrane protein